MALDYYKLGNEMEKRGLGLDGDYLLPLSYFANGGVDFPPSRMKSLVIEHPNYGGARCLYKKDNQYYVFTRSQLDIGTIQQAFKLMLQTKLYELPNVEIVRI